MCGIAGFYNDKIDRLETIKKMNSRMFHRGPDAGGYWLDPQSGWTFGHKRLAILDLSEAGAQPMMSKSQRYIISYNGEIYNIKVVRDSLIKAGVDCFRGSSDTEVLLESVDKFGLEHTLKLCKGMFAFALYDREKKELYLARDRVGEKPLYYGFVKSRYGESYFAFASDVAVLTQLPDFDNEIDYDALADYMLYSYIPAPKSIYKGICKLKPGTFIKISIPYDKINEFEYWSMEKAAIDGENHLFQGTEQDASDELESLLNNAIKDQIIADVPVGAFLSGGIDSATVVSLMQSISTNPVKTFTIGFDDPKYNESDYANDIAKHLGTDHTEMIISEREMQEAIPQMGYFFSEPFGDASMIPTYFVSKIAKEKVTVSLSGDAGDELFCGYDGYWKTNSLWMKISKMPKSLLKVGGMLVNRVDGISAKNTHRLYGICKSDNICQLKEVIFNRKNYCFENIVLNGDAKDLSGIESKVADRLSNMQLHDMLIYHPDDILVKVDRAGMAVSLENRIPMLDRDVVEFSWKIPSEYKYKDGVSKRVLRNILYKYVPKEMMERPKQGFCIPLEKWLSEGKTREWAEEMIYSNHLAKDGILDKRIVEFVWEHLLENKSMATLVWNVLMAEQWYRNRL